jgi:hypothetical protein
LLTENQNIRQIYSQLKTNWEQEKPIWEDIAAYVGISVNPDGNVTTNNNRKGDALDVMIDDPTCAISVNQAGDYMAGILVGTGDKLFDIIPSRHVEELVDKSVVEPFYKYATRSALFHINHPNAGFSVALRPYAYDQIAFGTSGIGTFKNNDFINGVDENALNFKNYGVDNLIIDEGRGMQVDTVFVPEAMRVNRIIQDFCFVGGALDNKLFAKMPQAIRDAYNTKDLNKQFVIVFGFFPRANFNPKMAGKRGTRYKGVWFMDGQNDDSIFREEDFAERPIAVARAIKVRNEVYGRASGTMLISTIRSVNFMVGNAIEIVEKMSNPALGILNNAIFGDSVLDSSPNSLTVFNDAFVGKAPPIFPIADVGDPSAILKFLLPYLNEKIATAFKIDVLLDFSSAKDMTATESLQRYAIRGKSLSGTLLQQKNEVLVPVCKRSISLLYMLGELGVNPILMEDKAKQLAALGLSERIIPEAVLQVIAEGKPWYELRFNNELEKLTRTEAVQNLLQVLQAISAIMPLYPQIAEGVNWFKLLLAINENLDANSQILLSEKEFKDKIMKIAQANAQAVALQAGQAGAEIQQKASIANKNNTEAANVAK